MDNKNSTDTDNTLQRILELLRNSEQIQVHVNNESEENEDDNRDELLDIIGSLVSSHERLCSIVQRYMNRNNT